MFEQVQEEIERQLHESTANVLGSVAGMAVVMEASGNLTAEQLVDYCRSMANRIGAGDQFTNAYMNTLAVAREEASKRDRDLVDRSPIEDDECEECALGVCETHK